MLECPYCFCTDECTVYMRSTRSYGCRERYYVLCEECGMRGAIQYSEEEAIEAWKQLKNTGD